VSETDAEPASSRLDQLRSSARGWHGVQLAVIGFIGLCGVLQGGRPDNPMWIQVLAGVLALAALFVACVATFLVARVAWPLYGGREVEDLEREGARLRKGLAPASGWWPQDGGDAGESGLVSVQAASGERWCGPLGDAGPGRLSVSVDGDPVVVSLGDVAVVAPAESC
jgi:hypothetical protein